jgi:hypothetical protein
VVPSYSPSGSHYFALRPTTNCDAATWRVEELEFYTGIDDAVSMKASATDPLIMAFASGKTNYFTEVTASQASLLSSLTPGRTHFAYADRNISTGAITYGKTPIAPQYGREFDATKHSLLHFEGSDAATTMNDEYGHAWTAYGNAQLETGGIGAKLGSAYLLLDGTGDYIKNTGSEIKVDSGQPFALEIWWHTTDYTTNYQVIFAPDNVGMLYLDYRYSDGNSWFSVSLSSNGSSWDMANSIASPYQTVANNTWYKIIFEWDGYYYRVWFGTSTATMKLISTIKSSTVLYQDSRYLCLGGYPAGGNYTKGGLDEFRATIGSNRYGWSPVAETSALSKYDFDMHFFDLTKMKMYYGGGSSWTECQRLFLGEAYMDAHGITDLRNYALRGQYKSMKSDLTASTIYTRRHNLGVMPRFFDMILVNKIKDLGWYPGEEVPGGGQWTGSGCGNNGGGGNRTAGYFYADAYIRILNRGSTGSSAITMASWQFYATAERGW